MSRSRSEALTEREAQIMDVLWRLGPVTAEQVREALADGPHDSTVRTLLRVLESKGYVVREDRGTAYTFRAAIERARAQRTAVRSLMKRFFSGSAEDLLLRLMEDEQLTPQQLEEIRQAFQTPRPRRTRGGSR